LRYGSEPTPQLHDQPPLHAPAHMGDLYPDNALFWDTALWGEAEPDVPSLFWDNECAGGYTLPPSHIDHYNNSNPQRGIYDPALPELRYRGAGSNRFSGSTDVMRQ